jgi:hypothetical protein
MNKNEKNFRVVVPSNIPQNVRRKEKMQKEYLKKD